MAQTTFRLLIGDRDLQLKPGELTFGRTEECTVLLDDAVLSRVHARMVVTGTAVMVEDLGSKNGTFVNETRISEPVRLLHGDQIRLGRTQMELSVVRRRTRSSQAQIRTLGFATQVDVQISSEDSSDVLARLIKMERFDEASKVLKSRVGVLTSQDEPPPESHFMSRSLQEGLLTMAESTMDAVWLHRLFQLSVRCGWLLAEGVQRKAEQLIRAVGGAGGDGLAIYVTHWQSKADELGQDSVQRLDRLHELVNRSLRSD